MKAPGESNDPIDSAIDAFIAELSISETLKRLPTEEQRARVAKATAYLFEAERLVPGILLCLVKGAVLT